MNEDLYKNIESHINIINIFKYICYKQNAATYINKYARKNIEKYIIKNMYKHIDYK